jgi:hypothetical protein
MSRLSTHTHTHTHTHTVQVFCMLPTPPSGCISKNVNGSRGMGGPKLIFPHIVFIYPLPVCKLLPVGSRKWGPIQCLGTSCSSVAAATMTAVKTASSSSSFLTLGKLNAKASGDIWGNYFASHNNPRESTDRPCPLHSYSNTPPPLYPTSTPTLPIARCSPLLPPQSTGIALFWTNVVAA